MKRILYALLCVVLTAVICFSLAACRSGDVSGLGKLTMDDGTQETGGIGKLGGSDGTDNNGGNSDGTEQVPATEAPPQTTGPAGMSTEKYEGDAFSATIPAGWEVKYDIYDSGIGINYIIISVTDPADSNNSLFFATAFEPFFTSVTAKNACLPYVAEYYEWAPVMDEAPSAEATLWRWPNVFTMLQAEGLGYDAYFRNYSVREVIGSQVGENATDTDVTSAVTAWVSIPGADKLYQMYYQNNLVLDAPAAGLPSEATYYRSYSNYGAVLREDLADQYASLLQCLQSFEFKTS